MSMSLENWEPKTKLGKTVKKGEVADIDAILESGEKILEPEIVDMLIPDIKAETILITPTQRTTDSGRKVSFRAIVAVGDGKGHVGVGVGKSQEVGPAVDYGTKQAKKNIIKVKMGCGSWECQCGHPHSLPRMVVGREGSTIVTLKPAPRGLGLAANDNIKIILKLAGIKDVWSSARGATDNVYNTITATIKALDSLNKIRPQPGR
ncbi:MAG: 30S ribosomal protein S5 [Candidatus Anstonellales archaeon]